MGFAYFLALLVIILVLVSDYVPAKESSNQLLSDSILENYTLISPESRLCQFDVG